MSNRLRRHLGCLGVLVIIAGLVALVNAGMSWHYRRAGVALTPEGYPKTFDKLVERHNGDDGRPNGARDLVAAFEAFTDEGIDYDLLPVMGTSDAWPQPGEAMRPDVLIEMNEIVLMNRESLALLRSGTRAADVRFPIQAEFHEPFPIDQFSQARNAGRLLVLQALCAADANDMDTAIESVQTVLALGDWYARQPSFLTQAVGTAIAGLGMGGVQSILERGWVTRPEDFERMSALFEDARPSNAAYTLWGETLWVERSFDRPIPLAEALSDFLVDESWAEAFVESGKYLLYTYTFVSDWHGLEVRRHTALLGTCLNEPLLNGMRVMERSAAEARSFGEAGLLRDFIMDNLENVVWSEGLHRARLRSTATACRIAAFHAQRGRLPDANEYVSVIEPLRDPMDGEPLRYRAEEDGFVVYSVGVNGRDNGGEGSRAFADFTSEFRLPR